MLRNLALVGALAVAGASAAQTVDDTAAAPPASSLNLPTELQIFGKVDPNVRKPTAIVNKFVVTGTDVDQRVAMIAALNDVNVQGEELQRLKLQVLRQLIDETLQIGAAKEAEITISSAELDQSIDRIVRGFNRTRPQMATFLRSRGSAEGSLRRQVEGEMAWQRLLRRRVEPTVNVSDEEVKSILERLQASAGSEEYHLKEIFLSSTPEQQQQVAANAARIIDEIRKQSRTFEYFAANFSDATTRAVQGDLGWVRPATLPESLASAANEMQPGQIAGPIDVGGGYSIVWLVDKRKVLTADPRDAKLDLRQLTVDFAPGISPAQAQSRAADFTRAIKDIKGCGDVSSVASAINAKVVTSDSNRVRDLPPQLQEILLKMQVGEVTPAFGSPDTGVRALVLCGRDDSAVAGLPDAARLKSGLESDRVNRVAQRMLRDLRRDAVIEYK
ncbi:MAG: peptidylprolyl isomerase [Pseudomonadota bacterium]